MSRPGSISTFLLAIAGVALGFGCGGRATSVAPSPRSVDHPEHTRDFAATDTGNNLPFSVHSTRAVAPELDLTGERAPAFARFECDEISIDACLARCKSGNLPACTHIGYLLQAGARGLPHDERRALRIWRLACSDGEAKSCTALNLHYSAREDWKNALRFGSKGCRGGDPNSCTNIAVQAFYGRGTKRNRAAAYELWDHACKMRDFMACNNAAVMTLYAMEGVPASPPSPRSLLQRACDSFDPQACANLATCFEHGLGGAKDFKRAMQLYLSSCTEANNASACISAGLLVEENSSRPEHRTKALRLYERGCRSLSTGGCLSTDEIKRYFPGAYSEEGFDRRGCEDAPPFALACYNAAIAHERGYGGFPDRDKAKHYLELGCRRGKLHKACRAPRLGEPTRI